MRFNAAARMHQKLPGGHASLLKKSRRAGREHALADRLGRGRKVEPHCQREAGCFPYEAEADCNAAFACHVIWRQSI